MICAVPLSACWRRASLVSRRKILARGTLIWCRMGVLMDPCVFSLIFYQRNNFIFYLFIFYLFLYIYIYTNILPYHPAYVQPNNCLCSGREQSTSSSYTSPLNFVSHSHMPWLCVLGTIRTSSCFSFWRLVYLCCSSCVFTPQELCLEF